MGRSAFEGVSDGQWAVFAEKVVAERDELRAELAVANQHTQGLAGSLRAALDSRDQIRALLRECHHELLSIEAITVSPSDTDGLLNLVRRVGAALEAK